MLKVALLLVSALSASCDAAQLRAAREPNGAGKGEHTMQAACDECNQHAQYLPNPDDCVCFATDVNGTFEDDSTKTTTAKIGSSKAGHKGAGTHSVKEVTTNIGAERLPESWMWHCRPITDSEGVWQQC